MGIPNGLEGWAKGELGTGEDIESGTETKVDWNRNGGLIRWGGGGIGEREGGDGESS